MNDLERERFWNTICSLDGIDVREDSKKLQETIISPKKIYRYRPISVRSLEALKNNKLYFSTANYYDDPFDTFINVRIKEIRSILAMIQNADSFDLVKIITILAKEFGGIELNQNTAQTIVKQIKEPTMIQQNIDVLENYFRNIRNEIKKETLSVCFSESPLNETLWLKYGDQHKGFSVEYDLYDDNKMLCGKQENCKNCGVNIMGLSLYPIYYSDEMYDATKFAQFLAACKQFGNNLPNEIYKKLQELFGNQVWEREKITLIKKTCHKYDEEWRMIINGSISSPFFYKWIPSAIYLGLNMESSEMYFISDIAKNAGIENIYKCIITDEGRLDAVLVN